MVMEPVAASVIIPVYGDPALLANCLNTIGTVPELILVDNAQGNWDCSQALVIRNPRNTGFAVACNQGAALAAGELLVFLNVDTEPTPGWLDPLVASPHDITGSRLLYPDGRVQHAGIWLDRPDGILTAHNYTTEQPAGEREAVTGACMAVRRETFYKLGGFDTGYWNGYEDVDLCLRAGYAGHTIWYEPASTVVHLESATGPERWTGVQQNIARLNDLHSDYYHPPE